MDFGWREIAAIWGATLSTIIAVMTIFPARPIFQLEPDEMGGWAKLRVVNPNQRSMLLRDVYRIRLNDDDAGLGLSYGELAIVNVGMPGAMTPSSVDRSRLRLA